MTVQGATLTRTTVAPAPHAGVPLFNFRQVLPIAADVEAAAAQLVLRIGAVLMNEGVLTPQQLGAALVECDESGKRLGEVVVEHGWATSRDVAQALAKQYSLEFVDLEGLEIDPGLAGRLPVEVARRYSAIPVAEWDDGEVLVAVADPTDAGASGELEAALARKVRLAVCEETELANVLDRVYGLRGRARRRLPAPTRGTPHTRPRP